MAASRAVSLRRLPLPPPRLCRVGKNLLGKQLKERKIPEHKLKMGERIRAVFDDNRFVFVFHYNSLNSQEWSDLRFNLKRENVAVTLFPNKITAKVLGNSPYQNMAVLFHTETAIAYTSALNVKEFLKLLGTHPRLELLAAKVDNAILSRQQVIDYSKLPAIETLHAELVQLLSQPSQTLASLLNSNQAKLSSLLTQYSNPRDDAPS